MMLASTLDCGAIAHSCSRGLRPDRGLTRPRLLFHSTPWSPGQLRVASRKPRFAPAPGGNVMAISSPSATRGRRRYPGIPLGTASGRAAAECVDGTVRQDHPDGLREGDEWNSGGAEGNIVNCESDPGKLGSLSMTSYSPYSMRAIYYVPLAPPVMRPGITGLGTLRVSEGGRKLAFSPEHETGDRRTALYLEHVNQ
jgi:hypothetical protein